MVNVNKSVAKAGAQTQTQVTPAAIKRRPRNTELNSSKKGLTPLQKRIQNARKNSLNSSRRNLNSSRWDWEEWDNYAKSIAVTDAMKAAVDAYESGLTIEKALVPNRAGVRSYLKNLGVDALLFVYDTEDPNSYEEILGWDGNKVIDTYCPYNLADVLDRAVGLGSDEALDSSRKFGEFEYRPISTQELAINDGISLEELQSFIDEWKSQGHKVLGFLKCDDYAATGKDVLVETDDGVYIWDEGGDLVATEEFDSSCNSEASQNSVLNSAEGESGEPAEAETGETAEGAGGEVAMITTESGNEVALDDIKIIQNPDTNELMLFVKETEDDEIPEGFVVIADAARAALPVGGEACPECGQNPCVCEGDGGELNSSKKKT